ncbi:hypothetical protein [Nocardioides hwasunensis]|uniref:Uncharacterized protein n=1 Tax=Nocardioides hwasunensis TaxID=397258 RepID=A0ABR8MM74_9ACTN|nr:hypothetical protein [Nocardioides hwasunensis]MBD3917124.1 hypothetical protein [Nocardioides hwasunensis]
MMEVLNHAPAAWYLLADGDALLLDVNCNHGAIGYSVLIELSDAERDRWTQEGRDYLDTLSHDIHFSAPIVSNPPYGEVSPYRARDLTRTRRGEVSDAVRRWCEQGWVRDDDVAKTPSDADDPA